MSKPVVRRRSLVPPVEALEARVLLANLPAGFVETTVADQLPRVTAMEFAPDGRLFVATQNGDLRVIKDGQVLATPFVHLDVDSDGERGLLGVAFDPDFDANQYVYVYYTVPSPAHNRISRFTASGDVAAGGSEQILLDINNLSGATNHNGGAIHFGPDGKLYAGVGENANPPNAQSMNNLLGKILRVNSDGSIPTDNPFYGTASGKNRAIWATGLRNPYTFAFQPGTGRMFINDVGQETYEEINDGIAGANYGWPNSEGPTTATGETAPLHYYPHTGGSCAITGGTFYNPATGNFPAAYEGRYFFADYCAGWIKKYNPATDTVTGFASGIDSPVDVETGPDGALYYLDRQEFNSGQSVIRKIDYSPSSLPTITAQPQSKTVNQHATATFNVAATGPGTITYQWQRDRIDIDLATSPTLTIPNVSRINDDGAVFRCIVTNSAGSRPSEEATLNVSSNRSPRVTITSPAVGAAYQGGQALTFSASARDAEDGVLGESAFSWYIVFHHNSHTHPFRGPIDGVRTGTFTIPRSGETSAHVFYRVQLTVTDSEGATTVVTRDVLPRTARIAVASNVAGLLLRLDGQPKTAPIRFTGVTGIRRSIEAPASQTVGGKTYEFVRWSDGGAALHDILTPREDRVYTAVYRLRATGAASRFSAVQIDPAE